MRMPAPSICKEMPSEFKRYPPGSGLIGPPLEMKTGLSGDARVTQGYGKV